MAFMAFLSIKEVMNYLNTPSRAPGMCLPGFSRSWISINHIFFVIDKFHKFHRRTAHSAHERRAHIRLSLNRKSAPSGRLRVAKPPVTPDHPPLGEISKQGLEAAPGVFEALVYFLKLGPRSLEVLLNKITLSMGKSVVGLIGILRDEPYGQASSLVEFFLGVQGVN
jgi:hypothetical protein